MTEPGALPFQRDGKNVEIFSLALFHSNSFSLRAHRIVDAGSWSPTPKSWVTLIYERGRILGKTAKYEMSKQREDEWGKKVRRSKHSENTEEGRQRRTQRCRKTTAMDKNKCRKKKWF